MTALLPKDTDLIQRAPLLMDLPEKELGKLLDDSHVVKHPRGKLLFLRGEPSDHIYLLLEGWVKVFRDTHDGEQTVIGILKPGETIAEAAIFLGRDYPASAEAVSDCRLLEIPSDSLLSLLRDDSELAIRMLGTLSQRMRGLVLHIEQIQARSTPQRLGEFLLGLCDTGDAGDTSAIIELPYDKSLVAARLGMKPESLSRALVKLRDFGVTTSGHQVTLDDIPQLRKFCIADHQKDSGSSPC
ncbi:MAG: cyclic nucleotide-binding domain-containing protein [Rhodospirillaceae bacterium]|nr:cyclic nucleotide-binding domain-containing protein [Rhodospirillaceae bacterium]